MAKNKPRLYTTSISAERRVADMGTLFAKHSDLIDSYVVMHEGGKAAAFAVEINGVGYRFSPNVDGVRQRMEESGALIPSNASPRAVAWGQLYTLIEMQLEFIASGVADVEDVFGGHAIVGTHTVGDMIRERRREIMPGENLLVSGSGN